MGPSFEDIEGLNEPRSYLLRPTELPRLTQIKIHNARAFDSDVRTALAIETNVAGAVTQVAFARIGLGRMRVPGHWVGVVGDGSYSEATRDNARRVGFEVREFTSSEALLATAFELMKEVDFGPFGNLWMIEAERVLGSEKPFWLEYLQTRVEDPRALRHREVDVLSIIDPPPVNDPRFAQKLEEPFQKLDRKGELDQIRSLPASLSSVALQIAYLNAYGEAAPRSRGVYGC